MKKVIYNVASFNREQTLIKAVESIFDQADIINIALNNYSHIPVELYDKKIRIFRTDNSKGDAFKFLELKNSNGYFFTIDDDIIYPKDYTEYMINKVEEYDRKKIITLHGRTYKEFPIDSYYNTPGVHYHHLKNVDNDVKVQVGGTGVMCFDTDLFKVDINYFEHPNMVDIWIGKYAKENNIDIICAKHKRTFLKHLDIKDTIYLSALKNDKIQTELINTAFTYRNKIAICIPIYQRYEITDFVLNYYKELKNTLKNEMELILICCGSEGEITENLARKNDFIYVEHDNLPLSQKLNALYIKAGEYNPNACIKIDSDSIISIEFFKHYNDLINQKYDYAGIEDIYFLIKNYFCYWSGYTNYRKGETVGIGRFMSNKLLNQLNWKPWGNVEINRKLDSELTKNIDVLNKTNLNFTKIRCDKINGMCIDIKTDVGISDFKDFSFDLVLGIEDVKINIDFSSIYNYLSTHNIESIKLRK